MSRELEPAISALPATTDKPIVNLAGTCRVEMPTPALSARYALSRFRFWVSFLAHHSFSSSFISNAQAAARKFIPFIIASVMIFG